MSINQNIFMAMLIVSFPVVLLIQGMKGPAQDLCSYRRGDLCACKWIYIQKYGFFVVANRRASCDYIYYVPVFLCTIVTIDHLYATASVAFSVYFSTTGGIYERKHKRSMYIKLVAMDVLSGGSYTRRGAMFNEIFNTPTSILSSARVNAFQSRHIIALLYRTSRPRTVCQMLHTLPM